VGWGGESDEPLRLFCLKKKKAHANLETLRTISGRPALGLRSPWQMGAGGRPQAEWLEGRDSELVGRTLRLGRGGASPHKGKRRPKAERRPRP
jgi:hypothetical protein